ncbi:hypothetical protein [Ponticaulis sp.]|uniref:hypothetical protein n=1 Tax=Ponticaulis sp. TaxID=2020902 RepID=UPI002624CBBF|nr:hypothetical protein [Ponticaulis sp.]MDF1679144.1 hypothetical protein [Ponticaulis sp.]
MPDTTPASAMFATSLALSIAPRGNEERDGALARLLLQHKKLRHAPLADVIAIVSAESARRTREQ